MARLLMDLQMKTTPFESLIKKSPDTLAAGRLNCLCCPLLTG